MSAFYRRLFTDVDEGRVDQLAAVRVEAVLGDVLHLAHILDVDADELEVGGIVWQGKAQGIERYEILALHGEGDDVACLVCLLVGYERDAACNRSHLLAAYTALQLCGNHRDVVGINQAVAVDVAIAYIALEVLVALAQTAIVTSVRDKK